MLDFEYVRPDDIDEAVAIVTADPHATFLAGGTTHLDLLLKDAIIESSRLVDITRLALRGVTVYGDSIYVGALTTMEELATHAVVRERLALVSEALLAGASTQIRNMATIGGNLLQRTRCRYFRDRTVAECNKRAPGTGCAAATRVARMHAILGASEHCIALHASDLCVPLAALDAIVHVRGADGEHTVPFTEFYVMPGRRPDVENVLEHGELITSVEIPLLRPGTRSGYLKVRDRASYEFALTSAAAALFMVDDTIIRARVALGGVGTVPWRAREAEAVLEGSLATPAVFRAAADAAIHDAFTVPGTAFKVELAKRTIVRILETVSGVET